MGTYALTGGQLFSGPTDSGNIGSFSVMQLTSDPNCLPDANTVDFGYDGNIVVTNVGSRNSPTQGTYSAMLTFGGTITGTFTAVPCIVSRAVINSILTPCLRLNRMRPLQHHKISLGYPFNRSS